MAITLTVGFVQAMGGLILCFGKHFEISKIREFIMENKFWTGEYKAKYGKISIFMQACQRFRSEWF